jgi:hypothetical protein
VLLTATPHISSISSTVAVPHTRLLKKGSGVIISGYELPLVLQQDQHGYFCDIFLRDIDDHLFIGHFIYRFDNIYSSASKSNQVDQRDDVTIPVSGRDSITTTLKSGRD